MSPHFNAIYVVDADNIRDIEDELGSPLLLRRVDRERGFLSVTTTLNPHRQFSVHFRPSPLSPPAHFHLEDSLVVNDEFLDIIVL